MLKLEAGKNYVTVSGEETGPLTETVSGLFRASKLYAINESGNKAGLQAWFPSGRVYAQTSKETGHTIKIDFPKRWEAQVTYRLAGGYVDVATTTFEEFHELGEFIEGNRDFHTVEEICVRLNREHLAQMFKKG